jgi:hypothetical protein
MAAICSICGKESVHYRQRVAPAVFEGERPQFIVTCQTCLNPRHAELAGTNPLGSLTLTHVHDELGQPVRVTSLRQLRAAEQRYHFRSVVANQDAANFDTPPEHKTGNILESMSNENKWLYPEVAEAMLKDMREAGEI